MRLVRRNGNSMEDVVSRTSHLRLRLRFASLILILIDVGLYTTWNFISQQRNETKIQCIVFYSLNFLKLVHVQNVQLLPLYTPNSDVEQSDIPSGLLLKEYHRRHVQISMNTGLLDTNLTRTLPQWLLLGIVQKPAWLHQHSRYQWNFSFFRTDLSIHLAPFHRLQTCLGFLLVVAYGTKFNPPTSLNFNNILHFPITLH